MSYENFIPSVWSAGINHNLKRHCVFVEDCNRRYEGDVKKCGDTVHILGVGRPSIYDLTRSEADREIEAPETIEDTSVTLIVDQIAYFNYKVGDIDKAQAVNGIMDALSEETSEALANKLDKYVAAFAVDPAVPKLYTDATKVVAGTANSDEVNVLDVLDDAITKLMENDVSSATEVVVTISPRFYKLFKKEWISKDTDNSEMLKKGIVTQYGNVTVKLSNNVHRTDSGATDNIMIRTKRAIAFVNPLTHTEAYRPEKSFADAVKGFVLYAGKVVRPKEIININVKY